MFGGKPFKLQLLLVVVVGFVPFPLMMKLLKYLVFYYRDTKSDILYLYKSEFANCWPMEIQLQLYFILSAQGFIVNMVAAVAAASVTVCSWHCH